MTRPQAKAIAKAVMLRDMAVGLARTGEAYRAGGPCFPLRPTSSRAASPAITAGTSGIGPVSGPPWS